MKRAIAIAAVLLLMIPAVSSAVDMTGKYGLGYFHKDAPVGVRYWVNENVGLDIGVGLDASTVYMAGEKETAVSFWAEVGVPYVIVDTDRANFFVRPGIMYASLDDRVYGQYGLDETWTQITLSLAPGAEIFFGDHFSLEAGHGFAVDLLSVPDNNAVPEFRRGETETTIRTFDASITYIGFHFYFE